MKKLLSLILCAIMLCSLTVLPTSAEDKMTIEEFEKVFFGEYYITDAKAAAFAIAGYPGAEIIGSIIDSSEIIAKEGLLFNLGEATEEKLALLDQCFTNGKFSYTKDDQLFVTVYYADFPGDFAVSYVERTLDTDLIMLNIKAMYALTQIAKECDGSVVRASYEWKYGEYGKTLHADVNGDLKINAKDILAIKRYIVGVDCRIAFCNTDPTNDNKFDAKDILQIKRYIVGIDDYTDYIIYPGPGGIYWNPIKGYFNTK